MKTDLKKQILKCDTIPEIKKVCRKAGIDLDDTTIEKTGIGCRRWNEFKERIADLIR